MTALTESKSVLKTKIVKSGQFADKGWNRIEIIYHKIGWGIPFKIGAGGTGPDVYGITYDSVDDTFTYVTNKNRTGTQKTVPRTKIFKDKDLGGGGGSRGGSDVTAVAESMQCYYNAYYFQKGLQAKPPTDKDLKNAKIKSMCFTTESVEKCLKSSLLESWNNQDVFIKIAKTLTKRYKSSFGATTTFHRGSSFMDAVYEAKKVTHKNDKDSATVDSPTQAPGSFSNDKWNPGDIWMTTLPISSKPLDHFVCSWGEINAEVEKLAFDGKLLGVSLKKVNGQFAKWKEFNRKKDINSKTDQEYQGFSFGQRGEFFNSIDCYTYGTHSKTQFRATQTDKSWQGELSSTSAAGGKIGGGNVDFYLRDVFGKGLWTTGETEARHKANNVDNAFIEEYWTLYQRFVLGASVAKQNKEHPNNPKTKEDFTSKFEQSSLSFKFSKYLCLKMLEVMYDGDAAQRKKLINLFYYYAASNTDQSSYFIKISDEGII